MPNTLQENINQPLELNGQNRIRNYSAEVVHTINTDTKVQHSCVALLFGMQYLGLNDQGNLSFNIIVNNRLFLDEKSRPVFKPSKAQQIALTVAKINDDIIFEVDKQYKIVGVLNSKEIQLRWQKIKTNLLQMYSDLNDLCADFDWQLQTENINQLFARDNFFNFFFANLFYQDFNKEQLPPISKTIANGFDTLDIPIIEERSISKQDVLFQNITISTKAKLDIENKKFPLEKMNISLGNIVPNIGANHDLEFNYKGAYTLKPRIGLITSGTLNYTFTITDTYQKTTTINFNLEDDE